MKLEDGMVAVVTGAASGIGRALAFSLAERGLAVALTDVEEAPLSLVADAVGAVAWQALDVADPAAVDAFAASVPAPHLVCNVAGVVGPRVPTWEQTAADWQWVWQVNLFGTTNVLRAFVPALVARGAGHVVNVSSIAGLAPIPGGGNGPYVASKYAVVGVSESLRVELDEVAPAVGVTIVCPGPVETRILEAERNRPVALGGSGGPAVAQRSLTASMSRITADDAAARILRAVEDDQMYLLTHPENAAPVRARVERLLADLP